MAKMYVRGMFYDRMGEETLKFTIDSELIDKVLTLEGEDEIDAFFEDLVAPHFASYLLGGILGEDDAIKNWNEHKAFNIVLEEFVFGVGPTKEAATMQWSEAMEINGDDDGWED